MRVKDNELTLEDAYKFFLKKYPKGHSNHVSKKTYKNVCYSFNKEISRRMIEEGEKIQLPYRLATIRVCKYKMSFDKDKLPFDFAHFNKTGEKRFILNEHSDEYKVYFFWQKEKVVVKNKSFYTFKACRANDRLLAKIVKEEGGHKKFSEKDEKFRL